VKGCESGLEKVKYIKEIAKLIEAHRPDIMSIENLFFFQESSKTVMPVSQTKRGHIIGRCEKKLQVL